MAGTALQMQVALGHKLDPGRVERPVVPRFKQTHGVNPSKILWIGAM